MNNKIKLILMVVAVNFLLSTGTSFAFMSQAKITVRVVDEAGKPVDRADVGIGFETTSQPKEVAVTGITDSEGHFSGSAKCNGYIGFKVVKSGYYKSFGKYEFSYKNKGVIRWEPWNPVVTIVLRKIENPVPMYARDTNKSQIEIPVTDKAVGFDLIAYDWVKPYGKGSHSDFIFKLKKLFLAWNDQNSDLSITFPDKYDGIQLIHNDFKDSILSLPKLAFDSGYTNKLNLYIKAGNSGNVVGYETNVKKLDNYMFRIRSEEKNGKFLRGLLKWLRFLRHVCKQ
jgi:hypothetical protein